MPILETFGNIIIPALSGIFLFILFLYFILIEESRSSSTKYFTIFLISFCIFLFGRPIQILSGPHPVPLIINNIRSLIFSAITIPMVILADFSQPEKDQKIRFWPLIIVGIIFGLIYGIFNTLSTDSAKVIFNIGSINIFDCYTPRRLAPYYGREVTIGVYMTLATILFVDSVSKIHRVGAYKEKGDANKKRVYLYNTGKIIFALTFFGGALIQQWWVYYLGSLVSVSFLGYGVALDIRENKKRLQKVIAYIREDLIQDFSIDIHTHQMVSEMLDLLEIPGDINTFIILRESPGTRNQEWSDKNINDILIKESSALLDKILGKNKSILMSMGTDMLGLCLYIPPHMESSRTETIRICESLKSALDILSNFNIGIGRSYSGLSDLKNSYQEAVTAVEYASSIEGGQVIHITDIQDGESRREYPIKEKHAFLGAIRIGDHKNAVDQLHQLLIKLHYGNDSDTLLKVRVYELLGTMVESAIEGGGDVDELLEISEQLFAESTIVRGRTQMEEWLKLRTEQIIEVVSRSHSDRSQNIIRKAKAFIDEHYAQAISVKDVADEVCISESYFKSIFKKSSGYSYSEYITNVRMDRAKNLLNTTEKSITEIALDVGYQTPNSFSAVFKRQTGITPTQYKNSRKKQ